MNSDEAQEDNDTSRNKTKINNDRALSNVQVEF